MHYLFCAVLGAIVFLVKQLFTIQLILNGMDLLCKSQLILFPTKEYFTKLLQGKACPALSRKDGFCLKEGGLSLSDRG